MKKTSSSTSFSSLSKAQKGSVIAMDQWLTENKKALAAEFGGAIDAKGNWVRQNEISK